MSIWENASTPKRGCSAPPSFYCNAAYRPGITIYAPAIILSTVLGWRLDLTIIFTGILVIIYTVTGGSAAVKTSPRKIADGRHLRRHDHRVFVVLLTKLPADALHIAGAMGKLQAVDFTPDLKRRYTFWSGMLGGLFLSLSYFGTDQSQVQRYIGGAAFAGEGRLGLMFNAVFKIPMQFFIVMLGALLFVFYQFQPDTPVFFNQTEWRRHVEARKARRSRPSRKNMPSCTPTSRKKSARGSPSANTAISLKNPPRAKAMGEAQKASRTPCARKRAKP